METIFGNFGMLFSESELTAILRETRHDNDPLMLHVSGYPAASTMLKVLQSNGGSAVWSTRRVRFEHGDGLYPDLIPSAKALGIVVVQNPTHLAAGSVLPGLVLTKAQPLRSLLDAGIPVALGSDGPMNPYLNIMLASIHPDRPAEAITREQAVIAYTRGSAYAEFAEKEKGSLEPGMLADLAVLSQDIFTTPLPGLPKTESVLTLVGGKVVYDAKVVHPQ
jgi:predicted amidohydrolase YtcJ